MKILIVIFLAAAAVVSADFHSLAAEDTALNKVTAYYFHGEFRCPTCRKLEQYSREAIELNFTDAVARGQLEFKIVNIEERGNEHFADDYRLYTKSLVLSLVKDGKEIKWKNLGRIWEYAGDKQKFFEYVNGEINDFLKGAQ